MLLTLLRSALPWSCAKPWFWCLEQRFQDLRARYVFLVPQGSRGSFVQRSPTPKMVFLLFSLIFFKHGWHINDPNNPFERNYPQEGH